MLLVCLRGSPEKGFFLAPDQTLEADAAGQARFASDTMPKLMFVLLPIFALLLKSVYPGRLYFDHLIYSLHLHSAMYVMLVILLLFEETSNTNWLSLGVQIALLVYLLALSDFVRSARIRLRSSRCSRKINSNSNWVPGLCVRGDPFIGCSQPGNLNALSRCDSLRLGRGGSSRVAGLEHLQRRQIVVDDWHQRGIHIICREFVFVQLTA